MCHPRSCLSLYISSLSLERRFIHCLSLPWNWCSTSQILPLVLTLDKWLKEGRVIKLNIVTLAGSGAAAAPNLKMRYLCCLVFKIFNRSRLLRTVFNRGHSRVLTRHLVSLSLQNVHSVLCLIPFPGDNLLLWLTDTFDICMYQSRSIFIAYNWKY